MTVAPVYRYFAEEDWARDFIERGQLQLCTMAYYRGFEDADIRRDPDDGRLMYHPSDGLQMNHENGQVYNLEGYRFTASVKAAEMFVYCMSNERSEFLAERFESPFCVEIRKPISLAGKMLSSIRLRRHLDGKRIYHGPVDYRGQARIPAADWALPERLAFIKPNDWAWQNEYRFIIGRKGTFAVENVELALVNGPGERAPAIERAPLRLSLGNLSKIAELQRF
ncbi:hypothetical protein [Sphingobium boeckii]|uniref:Uncharacterized protein n=1 Tax=Sphingobium boeckii TaxID=1082345 RepID=A0A7W9AL26_9SPHN|nr:hypothetical protein [Sphingobium boeckii]MBB5687655.1 hypothetical protein [Sphingobium boeckii]